MNFFISKLNKNNKFSDTKLNGIPIRQIQTPIINKEKVVGFIGSVENKFKINSDELYKNLQSLISSDKNFKQIDLNINDEFILSNEWESNNIVLGIRYEKPNKYITLAIIYKNELPTFYDKIFYSEFLDLTKWRVNKAEVQLKELNVKPAKADDQLDMFEAMA